MQVEAVPYIILYGAFFGGCILFSLYLLVKTCISGNRIRTERQGGTPRTEDLTVIQASYGFETSYSPGIRASSAGPLPVGGKVERPPTRSFSSYTNPRTKSQESEHKKQDWLTNLSQSVWSSTAPLKELDKSSWLYRIEKGSPTDTDAVSILVCPVVLAKPCRNPKTTCSAPLVPDVVRPPTASSTANHFWIVFLAFWWSAFSHRSRLLGYFGGGETRITLSPRTMTVSTWTTVCWFVSGSTEISSASSRMMLRCWSNPRSFPFIFFLPFSSTSTWEPIEIWSSSMGLPAFINSPTQKTIIQSGVAWHLR